MSNVVKIINNTKTCPRCKAIKTVDKFYKSSFSKHGYSCYCRLCSLKESKRCLDNKIKTISGCLRHKLQKLKNSAKYRGLEFNLTFDYLIELYGKQNGRCALTTEILTWRNGRIPTNISVDRIDNTKGYTQGNIQFVCDLVNIMKHSSTTEEFFMWCNKIVINNKGIIK